MGLIEHYGVCHDCGMEFTERNAHGLAAAHAKRKGHQTTVRLSYAYGPSPQKEGTEQR